MTARSPGRSGRRERLSEPSSLSSARGEARPRGTPPAHPRGDDPGLVARVHRRHGRHRRPADDRGGPRPRPHRAAVGLPLLLAVARGSLSRRRRGRRPLRAPARLHRRRRRVRARVGARRRRHERGGPDRRARPSGRGRRVPDHELPRSPARRLRSGVGTGDRALDLLHERGDDRRPSCRGRARRVGLVALDLLHQPAARGGDGRPRAARALRRAPDGPRGAPRPSRRGARGGRLRLPDLRPRRGRRPRVRRALVVVRRGRRGARRVRGRRTAGGRADAPLRAFPATQLRGCERGDVPRLRRALRVLRLLHALPPVHRLHALRGRAPQHSLEPDR